MRGIVAGAAYVPSATVDGRRSAGTDEDGFTLAATALERLADSAGAMTGVQRLLLVGDLPANAETDLPQFLGAAVVVERFGSGTAGLREAIGAGFDSSRGKGPVLLVAVDMAARAASGTDLGGPGPQDASVALLLSDAGVLGPEPLSRAIQGTEASSTAALFTLVRNLPVANAPAWMGDWDASAASGRPAEAHRSAESPLPAQGPFSQGAYVPRARYRENLPSRWRFAAEKCVSCGTITFPARHRCRQCGNRDRLELMFVPRDGGTVVASTVIGPGGQPTEFDDQVAGSGAYGVVLVDLLPGVRVTLQVTDAKPGELPIGSRVATRLRRLYPMEGEWRYGRKAIPH